LSSYGARSTLWQRSAGLPPTPAVPSRSARTHHGGRGHRRQPAITSSCTCNTTAKFAALQAQQSGREQIAGDGLTTFREAFQPETSVQPLRALSLNQISGCFRTCQARCASRPIGARWAASDKACRSRLEAEPIVEGDPFAGDQRASARFPKLKSDDVSVRSAMMTSV
jgi:hypothetical protein